MKIYRNHPYGLKPCHIVSPYHSILHNRIGRPPDQMGQDPSQGGTYVWKTYVSRRREYPEEGDDGDEYRRPHEGQWPMNKGQAYRMFAKGGSGGRFLNLYPDAGGPPGERYPGGGPPDGGGPPGPPGGQGPPGP